MAPIGSVDMMGLVSSPEMGIISLVVFLILCVTLLGLCVKCHGKTTNAYDVSGTTTDGAGGANGAVGTNSGETTDPGATTWRDHKNMPPSTLERSMQQ